MKKRTFLGRCYDLLIKLISIKGLMFGIGTYLLIIGKIDDITWTMLAGGLAGIRAWEKGNVESDKKDEE